MEPSSGGTDAPTTEPGAPDAHVPSDQIRRRVRDVPPAAAYGDDTGALKAADARTTLDPLDRRQPSRETADPLDPGSHVI